MHKTTALVLVTLALGCTEADGPLERVEGALNGSVIQGDPRCPGCPESCTPWMPKIRQAAQKAHASLANPRMDDCMRQAILSYTEDFPENVLAYMRSNLTTQVSCKDLGTDRGAEAPLFPVDLEGKPTEAVRWNTRSIDGYSPEFMADLLLHEVGHNKGHRHPNPGSTSAVTFFMDAVEYSHSIPQQLMRCGDSMQRGLVTPENNGPRRDSFPFETTLAPTGMAGGVPFENACPGGQAAFGVVVRSGNKIDAIGLNCRTREGNNAVTTTLAGGGGGALAHLNCHAGEVLVGVHGRAGQVNDAVGPICSPVADVNAGNVVVFRDPQRGGSGGLPYDRLCPPTMVVRAIKGKFGSQVDRLEVECHPLRVLENVSQIFLAKAGGSGGARTFEKCIGRSALVGLSVQAGALIDRLGGQCSPLYTTCATGTCLEERVGEARHVLPGHGGVGGIVFDDLADLNGCNTRTGGRGALVGLKVRTKNAGIEAVRGVCARVREWSDPGASAPTVDMPERGGTTGPVTPLICPRGAFLVGWEIGHGNLVDSIIPTCRDFR